METNHEDRWVADELDCISPEWRPDVLKARARLDVGLKRRGRAWPWMTAAAAAAACAVIVAIPETRAMAQAYWDRFVLNQVDIVRLDLSDLPLDTNVTPSGASEAMRDAADAERVAGFAPHLASQSVLAASPRLTVTPPITVQATIHVRDLESALVKAGVRDVPVPAEWDRARLSVVIGPMVAADYPDDVQILQARPFALSVPAGFALEHFGEVAFRSLGVAAHEAAEMGRKLAARPAWLFDIPLDDPVNIQELSLASGPALVVEDLDDHGGIERVTVILNTTDRIYAVSSGSRELSVRIASALPR